MNISNEQCLAFEKNPAVNPITKRKIQIGKTTHKKLSKACSPSLKKVDKLAPEMGPMIYWRDIQSGEKEGENCILFIEHIEKKVDEYEKMNKTTLSRMELDEFIILLQELEDYYSSVYSIKTRTRVIELKKRVEIVMQKHKLKNDLPKWKIVEDMINGRNRFSIRINIYNAHFRFRSARRIMTGSLKAHKITAAVGMGIISSIRKEKRYVEYAIKKNIFRYDDIYGKVWNSEKDYNDLEELFIKFGKLYKRVKGETLLIIPPDKLF